MILAELNRYYDRLASEPNRNTGKARVPDFGFSEEKIGGAIVLSAQGSIVDYIPNYDANGKSIVQRTMFVPASFKRSGKYTEKSYKDGKDNAFFAWDKTAYALGVEKVDGEKLNLSLLTHKSFVRLNTKLLADLDDEGAMAFLLFLEKWKPEEFDNSIISRDIVGLNVVFRLDGDACYLHEREALINIWLDHLSQSDSNEGICLISGDRSKISRIHPAIKGAGGQSSGVSIVTFNDSAYESYGKSQGENAPVSELAAFKYTTALNYLLNRDNRHVFSVADASTVFWAVADNSEQVHKAETLFSEMMNPSADDNAEAAQIRPAIEKIAKGRPLHEIAPDIDPQTRFYVLGLAPNAARLSIRYWLDTNFGELQKHLAEHYADLAMDPLPWNAPPSIWRLLIQLAPHRDGKKAKSEEIPSHMAGELMRSVLMGSRYPHSILAQLLLRVRADGHITPLRVAMIKAVLQRDVRKGVIKEVIPMSLDLKNTNEAYLLGRLFAVLERIQSSAIKEASATITDRYFSSASTVPYSVFPRLIAGCKNHLSKIRKDKPGFAVNLDKDVTEIIGKLPVQFSKHFSIENQGKFTIGYYQQREFDYKKPAATSNDATEDNLE